MKLIPKILYCNTILKYIWGQINKFLKNIVKHTFFVNSFLFQHNFFSIRYTWSTILQLFQVIRIWFVQPFKISLCFGDELSGGESLSSELFLQVKTGNNHRGLNLGNMLDGETIRNGIYWIWPTVPGTCEPVHYFNGRALSSSSNRDVFSLKCCWNGPIRRGNRHWSFASTESNRYELYRVQKTVTIIFPAKVFAFFGAGSPGEVHCFNYSFVSDVK